MMDLGSTISLGALGLGIVIAAWSLLAAQLGPLRLPDPAAVGRAVAENWHAIPAMQYIAMQAGGIADALSYTVVNVLVMVAIGTLAGTLVGVALPNVTPLRVLVTPALVVLGSTPVLILLPFLIQWFGTGRFVRSGLVIIFTFVVIATVCARSGEEASGRFTEYARSLGAGSLFEMIHVRLPALLPDLFVGLRVSLSAGWSLQAVAELVAGQQGAGRVIGTMANLANTTVILAVVVCLCAIAVVIDGIVVLIAGRVVRWRN